MLLSLRVETESSIIAQFVGLIKFDIGEVTKMHNNGEIDVADVDIEVFACASREYISKGLRSVVFWREYLEESGNGGTESLVILQAAVG